MFVCVCVCVCVIHGYLLIVGGQNMKRYVYLVEKFMGKWGRDLFKYDFF